MNAKFHFSTNPSLMALVIFVILLNSFHMLAQEYAIGADLSFLKQAEDNGFVFKEDGQSKAGLQIFKDHGYNWIRLRLFHSPTQLPNNLSYTVSLAKTAKKMGFKFLLDYHYSDTWADPGKQFLPKAWEGKSHKQLVDSVFNYTQYTMMVFRRDSAFPDMVQIGNEISNGMMWPDGKLPDNWDNLAELVQAGINGVYAGCGNQPCPQIMIHIDKGGDVAFTKYFFDKLNTYGIKYDVIGQSYYPWWHGTLLDLRDCLNFTAREYQKDVIVVEAAYNWKPQEYVGKNAPFPESPEGQKEFLDEVHRIVLAVPDNRGVGVFWWEPAVGRRGSRSYFDEKGNVLPVITVFDKFTRK
jgi:arabinogalactan endo-1,4-beta-galactosidase